MNKFRFLKTDSRARYQGYTFFFKEGFCWNNVLNPQARLLKAKLKFATVNDVGSMSLSSLVKTVPNFYYVTLLNSDLLFDFYREFLNCTVNIQINDIRQIPIIIPTKEELAECKTLFNKAVFLKKSALTIEKDASKQGRELEFVEKQINDFVNKLYEI